MFQCKGYTGYTKNNKQCKRKLNNKYYCKQHINQEIIGLQIIPGKIIKNIFNFLDIYSKINFTISCKYIYEILKVKIKNIDFNISIHYNKEIIDYLQNNKIKIYIKNIKADGNCGVYTIYEFLKNKNDKVTIKFLQFLIKKYINNTYENNQCIEMLDIVKILDCFGFGVVFKIISHDINNLYVGYNVKKDYRNNCFINYIENLHFDLLLPYKDYKVEDKHNRQIKKDLDVFCVTQNPWHLNNFKMQINVL